jgi:hypothetical protein
MFNTYKTFPQNLKLKILFDLREKTFFPFIIKNKKELFKIIKEKLS